MAKKELTRADFKDVESVVPTPEEREYTYSIYSLLINAEETDTEVQEHKEGRLKRNLWEALRSGNFKTSKEAFASVASDWEEKPLYFRLADSADEAVKYLFEVVESKARNFIDNREEAVRSTFCKEYLSPLVLAGMRSGLLVNTWWRATCYGFSVEPYTYNEETDTTTYNAFPYRSLEEMTKADKRAFLWTVEDVYYNAECIIPDGQLKVAEGVEPAFRKFTPYPKEGYTKEEIAGSRSDDGYTCSVDELYECWSYDMELFLPIALYRQGEAIYYAMKFKGTEYLQYIKSLNVEEDFNYGTEDKDLLYNNVMKEGYVWHSDK